MLILLEKMSKKVGWSLLLIWSTLIYSCQVSSFQDETHSNSKVVNIEDEVPYYAQRIINSYPQFSLKFEDNYIVFSTREKVIYDDHQEKGFKERLDNCDIEDMFSMQYDTTRSVPHYLSDCGRCRNEELFKIMYGHTAQEVRQHLVWVQWFGQNLQFTEVNDAAEKLQDVATELARTPQYSEYLTNASTFYWRKIRGTTRQSAHSYGIAIDINTKYGNYWLWTNPTATELDSIQYINRIPSEIVKVFERHGFIWGGRWYHFDTMHFEYRPELLEN